MVTRIRIEAEASCIEDVISQLNDTAKRVVFDAGCAPVQLGDHVIARDQNEPEGSDSAYKGRLVVHPPSDWLR